MRTLLLTGANGLMGQKVVQQIVESNNFHLIATARGENRLPKHLKGFTYVSLDVENESEVKSILETYQPDVVLHTAAMTNVDTCEIQKEACWKANVLATRYLANASASVGAHFIHVSTDFIFDGSTGPYKEEDAPAPLSFYGYSKWAAEEVVQSISNLRWSIARTVLVYGIAHDMSRTNIVLWVKNSLEQGKTIQVVDDQFRSPTLAEDLAKGCLLIADQKAEGVFNISGPDFLSPYEMAIETATYFKLDLQLISRANASNFKQTAKRPPITGFNIDKARKTLGFAPLSFKEGIAVLAKQIQK